MISGETKYNAVCTTTKWLADAGSTKLLDGNMLTNI
jgi:hypothetical protein